MTPSRKRRGGRCVTTWVCTFGRAFSLALREWGAGAHPLHLVLHTWGPGLKSPVIYCMHQRRGHYSAHPACTRTIPTLACAADRRRSASVCVSRAPRRNGSTCGSSGACSSLECVTPRSCLLFKALCPWALPLSRPTAPLQRHPTRGQSARTTPRCRRTSEAPGGWWSQHKLTHCSSGMVARTWAGCRAGPLPSADHPPPVCVVAAGQCPSASRPSRLMGGPSGPPTCLR